MKLGPNARPVPVAGNQRKCGDFPPGTGKKSRGGGHRDEWVYSSGEQTPKASLSTTDKKKKKKFPRFPRQVTGQTTAFSGRRRHRQLGARIGTYRREAKNTEAHNLTSRAWGSSHLRHYDLP